MGMTLRRGWLGLGLALLLPVPVLAASYFTLPDSVMLHSEFAQRYGPGSFTRTDVAGPGVQFDFTSLTGSATGVSDNYPVLTLYGQILPSHGNGDFSNFDGYVVQVTNLNTTGAVDMSLVINTGFTGPSGTPSNDVTNDTFWQSPWVNIGPGGATTLFLDFSSAIPDHIDDNKDPHTHGTNWVATAINSFDMGEFSNIGFQVADFGGSTPNASLLVTSASAPIPEPATCLLLAGTLAAGLGLRRRSNRQARRRIRR